jgi:hypothetical protein
MPRTKTVHFGFFTGIIVGAGGYYLVKRYKAKQR